MLNQDRIQTMIQLNRWEEGKNSEYIKLNHTYRSDYIGMALLKNFFCITIGYLLLISVGCLYHFDYLANNWFKMDLPIVVVRILMIYALLLLLYSVLVYIICSVKYSKMTMFIKSYDRELRDLEDLYTDAGNEDEDYLDDWEDIE